MLQSDIELSRMGLNANEVKTLRNDCANLLSAAKKIRFNNH